jgi:hypothetical protein
MTPRQFFAALVFSIASATACIAALPIELVVATQGDAPFGAMQEWNRVLAEMDLRRVRLRGATGGDEPSVEVDALGGKSIYRVVGLLNQRDQLVLPGGKFGQGDRAALKQYFEDLPKRLAEEGVERSFFGLTTEQFETVMLDLAKPVSEATLDAEPRELFAVLTRETRLPVAGDITVKAKIRDAAPFRSQMKGLSLGTTLAALLRNSGLQLTPDTHGPAPLTLRVKRIDPTLEAWPVGWAPIGGPRQIAPAMYRVTNIEVANFTLDKALAALAPHLGVPIVLDQYVIAQRKIDLPTVKVKVPRTKTYPRHALDRVLAQGRLAGELRVDELGVPFYWVTQFGKDSPKAAPVTPRR